MSLENISTKICKIGDYDDAIFFHSVCDCTSDDHGQQLFLEIDEDGLYVACTIYQDLFWMERSSDNSWFKRIWIRVKNAIRYLVTGHVRVSGEHLLSKQQHIKDYANALLGAVDELEKRKGRHRLPTV